MGIIEQLADLQVGLSQVRSALGRYTRVPEQRWGTVTTLTTSRLGVTFPGDSGEQVIDQSTEAVWLGAQVLVQVQGTARWIVGVSASPVHHTEFTGTISLANATQDTLGVLTLDAAHSPDSGMVDSPSAGTIRFIAPGLYAVTVAVSGLVPTGECFVGVYSPSGLFSRAHTTANDRLSVSDPAMYVSAANTSIGTELFQTSGGTLTIPSRVAVTRIN